MHTTVDALMGGEDSNEWNEEVICSEFPQEEADIICSIPLAFNKSTDRLVWHFGNEGKCTVRSGYRMLLDSKIAYGPNR